MNNKIEEILKELNCIVYRYDKENNLIFIDGNFSNNEHFIYKELIYITHSLRNQDIKYEIDIDNNIILA
jgi:hypothetical protein